MSWIVAIWVRLARLIGEEGQLQKWNIEWLKKKGPYGGPGWLGPLGSIPDFTSHYLFYTRFYQNSISLSIFYYYPKSSSSSLSLSLLTIKPKQGDNYKIFICKVTSIHIDSCKNLCLFQHKNLFFIFSITTF